MNLTLEQIAEGWRRYDEAIGRKVPLFVEVEDPFGGINILEGAADHLWRTRRFKSYGYGNIEASDADTADAMSILRSAAARLRLQVQRR